MIFGFGRHDVLLKVYFLKYAATKPGCPPLTLPFVHVGMVDGKTPPLVPVAKTHILLVPLVPPPEVQISSKSFA